jgi:MFS transporter, FHS family, glucose/mannose:H+ symporter
MDSRRFVVHPALYAAYFLAGVATILLGPTLPFLSSRWPISDALAGSLFAAQFGGGILGTILSTRFPRASLLGGFCISAAAIAFIGWAPWNLADALFFLNGIGLGSIIASGNILITQLASASGGSEASALAWVHLAWGLGAVSCPWLFQAATEASGAALFFALLGAAFGLLTLGLFFWDRNLQIFPQASGDIANTFLSPRTRCFYAIALLLYTGAENAISGWLPSYVTRIQAGHPLAALARSRPAGALAFTLLWAGTLSGRAAIPFALRFIRERTIYSGTILSLLMSLVLLMAIPTGIRESNAALCGISAACGLSLAGIYPLLMARLLSQSGGTRGIGWVLACASVGGASLPWLTGVASTCLGSLRAAMAVPTLAVSLLLILVPRIYSKGNGSVPWHSGSLTHHELG